MRSVADAVRRKSLGLRSAASAKSAAIEAVGTVSSLVSGAKSYRESAKLVQVKGANESWYINI